MSNFAFEDANDVDIFAENITGGDLFEYSEPGEFIVSGGGSRTILSITGGGLSFVKVKTKDTISLTKILNQLVDAIDL